MNWVLIAVIIILAGYTLVGYTKGFLKIVYSLISWLVMLIFVIFVTPYIENYLKTETELYNKVVIYCEDALRQQVEQELGNINISGIENSLSENELFNSIADKLPDNLLEKIKLQTSEMTEGIKEKTTEIAEELIKTKGIYGRTAVAIADLFLQGISTLIAIVLGAVASILISLILGFIGKLPIIGFANQILGLAAGAVNGLLVIWIAFYIVAIMSTTKLGSIIISQIYMNSFLIYLYENNLLLSILM